MNRDTTPIAQPSSPLPAGGPMPDMQRVRGCGAVAVRWRDGATRLARLYQQGAAKIRLPRVAGGAEAMLINTAGGLTGGDRLDWQVRVGPKAFLTATSPASEKIYRASAGTAEVSVCAEVAAGGRLAWLPQETILFDGAAVRRRLDVTMAPGGELLIVEPVIIGRAAMGETVECADFSDRWRIRWDKHLVHAEDLRLGPLFEPTRRRQSVLGHYRAFATLLWLHPAAADHVDSVRKAADCDGHGGEAVGGVSAWTMATPSGTAGKLLARLAAVDGYVLRRHLMPVIALLNRQAGLPKAWSL